MDAPTGQVGSSPGAPPIACAHGGFQSFGPFTVGDLAAMPFADRNGMKLHHERYPTSWRHQHICPSCIGYVFPLSCSTELQGAEGFSSDPETPASSPPILRRYFRGAGELTPISGAYCSFSLRRVSTWVTRKVRHIASVSFAVLYHVFRIVHRNAAKTSSNGRSRAVVRGLGGSRYCKRVGREPNAWALP